MSKTMKTILLIVILAALSLMVLSFVHYSDLGKQLSDLRSRLSESRTNWEGIAAEKEILQQDLDDKQLILKKAEQSLSDATGKTEELRAEISVLEKEIEALGGRD